MTTARDNILARVRQALGKSTANSADIESAEATIAQHRQGPRPTMPSDLVARFVQRARDMESSVEVLATRDSIPCTVARYLAGIEWPTQLADQRTNRGVCWPELASLDWAGAGLQIESRPAQGHDKLAVTGVFCAVAETGTLVVLSGPTTPTGSALLVDSHIAVVPRARIVSGMEEAFALVREERAALPRAVNFISGPSRTGDIEQTIVLGAHGPYRVHILIVP